MDKSWHGTSPTNQSKRQAFYIVLYSLLSNTFHFVSFFSWGLDKREVVKPAALRVHQWAGTLESEVSLNLKHRAVEGTL